MQRLGVRTCDDRPAIDAKFLGNIGRWDVFGSVDKVESDNVCTTFRWVVTTELILRQAVRLGVRPVADRNSRTSVELGAMPNTDSLEELLTLCCMPVYGTSCQVGVCAHG